MKIYIISKIKRKKIRSKKNHIGKMEGAYNPPNWSGKMDTRLTPVHRYVLEESDFPIIVIS
jgi:hypothetical protein